jgi:hypothetical protein
MSTNRNTNVNQTFIIEAIDDATFSACTGIYTNYIASCFGDVLYIGNNISSSGSFSGTSIYGTSFYSGGTNLSTIINNSSVYLTGGTYSNGTLTLKNNNLSTVNVTGFNYLDVSFNSHTGNTSIHFAKSAITLSNIGNSAHTHTIGEIVNLQNSLDNKYDITGGTINGDVTANYFYGDGSNLTNIIKRTEATKTTTDDGLYTIDTITGITNNTTRFIEIYVTAHLDINNYGFWKRTIGVTNIGGVSTVMIENYDTDRQSTGLNPTDVTFSGSGSDVLIQISGELSKTYNWISDWEIIKR